MAVDAALSSRAEADVAAPRSLVLQRAAAIPTWVWLTGIVAASFGGRLLAALGRVAPFYLPDEYIYPSLARGFAEHGRPLIRGVGIHFPALLEPLVTARARIRRARRQQRLRPQTPYRPRLPIP